MSEVSSTKNIYFRRFGSTSLAHRARARVVRTVPAKVRVSLCVYMDTWAGKGYGTQTHKARTPRICLTRERKS